MMHDDPAELEVGQVTRNGVVTAGRDIESGKTYFQSIDYARRQYHNGAHRNG
jgi:hypothetical protein